MSFDISNSYIDDYISSPQMHSASSVSSSSESIVIHQSIFNFLSFLQSRYSIRLPFDAALIREGWFEAYVTHLQENYSVETEHQYSRYVLRFLYHLSGETPVNFDISALQTYLDDHRRKKSHDFSLPPKAIIDTILTHASSYIIPPPETDFPDRNHLIRLRNKAFILVLADTGFKVSELSSLRASDFSNSEISFDNHVYKLSPATIVATRSYLSYRHPLDAGQTLVNVSDVPLFCRHDKRAGSNLLSLSRWTCSAIINYWVRLSLTVEQRTELSRDNIEISPSTFRHFFVLDALSSADSLSTAQTLARHADPSSTRRYRSLLPNADD
ncbi:MAG: tyrosine-type recombinase/integrase [Anaerolineae bacterium]|nr:tyrosine-type recombinase/integrase [Anaerolineae bacterium]